MEPIGHYCEFCGVYHSSSSCFHPGRALLRKAEAERDEWKTRHDNLLAMFSKWCGEPVPPEVSLLSNEPPSEEEIKYGQELARRLNWDEIKGE